MKFKLLILFILFAFSCKKSKTIIDDESKIDQKKGLIIEVLDKLPNQIDGCSELISLRNEYSKKKYVFATNLVDFGVISVNGKAIYLKKDTINSKQLSNERVIDVYKNDTIQVIMDTNEIEGQDELFVIEGKLIIKTSNSEKTLIVKGERGC